METASSDFQRFALLLSDRAEVLHDLVHYAPVEELSDNE
jgi:hypothetical protein